MEGNEEQSKFDPKDREISEADRKAINMKKELILVAASGIRDGDMIIIENRDKKGKIKDEIILLMSGNKSGLMINQRLFEVSAPYNDKTKGFSIKNLSCEARMDDGHMYRGNVYDTIKTLTGIDLEILDDRIKERGVIPLRFEGGGFVVRNNLNQIEVVARKNKKILCRNGVTYSMQVEGNIPEDSDLLEIFHNHPGEGEAMLIGTVGDLRNMIQLKKPSTIYADSPKGGFIGKEYKVREGIDLTSAEKELKNIDKEYMKNKNLKNYLANCSNFISRNINTRRIEDIEIPLVRTRPPTSIRLT